MAAVIGGAKQSDLRTSVVCPAVPGMSSEREKKTTLAPEQPKTMESVSPASGFAVGHSTYVHVRSKMRRCRLRAQSHVPATSPTSCSF